MIKKRRLFGSFLVILLLVIVPSISSMNACYHDQSYVHHPYDHLVNNSYMENSYMETKNNALHDVVVYSFKGCVVEQYKYRLHSQKAMYLRDMIEKIEWMNGSFFEKVSLVDDVFNTLDVNGFQSSASEFVLSRIKNSGLVRVQQDIRGFFGVLYGSFHSDYEDSGFLCLGYPFPFFNAFPMFFTGFGHGDLYFSGILEDESFGTHHLNFDEFVSLFSVFFFGTVVLFPLAYFGFQGFMFGISFLCMGSGR